MFGASGGGDVGQLGIGGIQMCARDPQGRATCASQIHEEPVNDHTYPPTSYHGRQRSLRELGVWNRMLIAAAVALMLQWGSAEAWLGQLF